MHWPHLFRLRIASVECPGESILMRRKSDESESASSKERGELETLEGRIEYWLAEGVEDEDKGGVR